jgi:Spy/CpxP family protein refolding chaperone
MRDANDRQATEQDLQRYHALLKSDTLDPDATKALQTLVEEAETRLGEIDKNPSADRVADAHRLRRPRQENNPDHQDEQVIHLDKAK